MTEPISPRDDHSGMSSRAPRFYGVVIGPSLNRVRLGAGTPGMALTRFLLRTCVTALALWVTAAVLSGITVSGSSTGQNAFTLIGVAAIFGIVNAAIKPVIQVLGCLFYLVTLGLIAFVVNALLFLATSWLAGQLGLPFHVHGFWTAFWGAIIVGVVTWAIGLVIPEARRDR
jgi:putative membrane protein